MLNHKVHYLIGSGPYLAKARVTKGAFGGIHVGVADAAQHLHYQIRYLPRIVCNKTFGFACYPADAGVITVGGKGCLINNAGAGIHQGNAAGKHGAHELELPYLLPERHAAVCVTCRQFQAGPHAADARRGAGDTFGYHHPIENECSAVERAKEIFLRHFHISESEPSGAAAASSHEAVKILDLDFRCAVNNESADSLVWT